MSAALSLGRLVFQRNRWGMVAAVAYLVGFAGLLLMWSEGKIPVAVQILGLLFIGFAYLMLIGAFVHPDADVGAPESTYPRNYLWLPVRTSTLSLVPMVFGSLVVLSTGLLLTWAARTAGVEVAQWWPPLALAAILSLLQAIFWSNTGFTFSKLALTMLLVPGMLGGIGYAIDRGLSERQVSVGLLAFMGVCYAAAAFGLSRARRGEDVVTVVNVPMRRRAARNLPPFRSPHQAQRWYEWRSQGLVLPLFVLGLFALMAIPMFWEDTLTPLRSLQNWNPPASPYPVPMVPTLLTFYYPLAPLLVVLIAWIVGCGTRRSETKSGTGALHLFFATRPLREWSLVVPKMLTALRSTLVAWTIVAAVTAGLLLFPGGIYDTLYETYRPAGRSALVLLLPYATPELLLRYGSLALLLVLATWRNYAIGFWTELSGKTWIRYGYPAAVASGIAILGQFPNLELRHALTFPVLAIIVWSLNGARLAVAATLAAKQIRSRMLSIRGLVGGVAGYASACTLTSWLALVASARVRQDMVDYGLATSALSAPLFVGLAVLWTPLVRILAAPMTLERNRHRP